MFCKTVWNGLHILPDGDIRLCSLGTNSKPELDLQRCRNENGDIYNIVTDNPADIINSDKHKEVRLFNSTNPTAWSPHCECCEHREEITGNVRTHPNKSRRIYLMKMETDNIVSEHNYKDSIDFAGNVNWMPSSLDIRFGNLCNQKCIMCGPVFSNLWYEEYAEFTGFTTFGQGSRSATIRKDPVTGKWIQPPQLQWYEDPRWWDNFEKMMPHLRHIYVTGGEPMVTPAHDEMLDRLIDSGYAKNIWLEYDTNCSAINHKIAARWEKFNLVDIRGSMDAIGDQYELIRFPGKWDKFYKNVKILKEYEKSSNGKIKFSSVSTCFQIPTMFSIKESEEWTKEVGVNFHLRFLEGPTRLSVASLGGDALNELIDYYKTHNTLEKSGIIVKYLERLSTKSNDDDIKEFFKFMNYLDSTRNTDWKYTINDVYKFMIKHYGYLYE